MITVTFCVWSRNEDQNIRYIEQNLTQPAWGKPIRQRVRSDGAVVYQIHGSNDYWKVPLGYLKARGQVFDVKYSDLEGTGTL